jgi:catechol 2,3-dioxygenase-like lactoylglutathione lyase family enzyme
MKQRRPLACLEDGIGSRGSHSSRCWRDYCAVPKIGDTPTGTAQAGGEAAGGGRCSRYSALRSIRAHQVTVEVGPVPRVGAKGHGTSVYFRDPDGSLLEFIPFNSSKVSD